MNVRILIDADGKVKKTEPVTTTGFPELDIIAFKFVKGWIFAPTESLTGQDEWYVKEVVLNVGGVSE